MDLWEIENIERTFKYLFLFSGLMYVADLFFIFGKANKQDNEMFVKHIVFSFLLGFSIGGYFILKFFSVKYTLFLVIFFGIIFSVFSVKTVLKNKKTE